MIFLLHGKKISQEFSKEIRFFLQEIQEQEFQILCTTVFGEILKKNNLKDNNSNIKTISNIDSISDKIDYLICFGGDGTILEAATIVKDTGIPIVGINTGRLGFLATISKDKLSTLLGNLMKNNYKLSHRSLLQIHSKSHMLKNPFALNEISVSSKENTSMINIKVFLNKNYLNTYWADGLIISTPTGSTGYSLSCGGPIVMPESNNFIITPIAPHNLNVRPLVISDKNTIKVEIMDRKTRKFLLSMDSRNEYIKNSASIIIKKAKHSINLVEMELIDYSNTLREKLLWGLDRRNYD